jgi:hypothetical protein
MVKRKPPRSLAELENVSTAEMTLEEYRLSDDSLLRTVVAGNVRYLVTGRHSAAVVAATTGGTILMGDQT